LFNLLFQFNLHRETICILQYFISYKEFVKNFIEQNVEFELDRESVLDKIIKSVKSLFSKEKLNFLILKLNSIRDTSIAHEMPQVYTEKLIERFGNSKTC